MRSSILLNETAAVFHKCGEDSNGKAIYRIFKLTNIRLENRDSVYASNRGLKPYDGFKLYFSSNHSKALDEEEKSLEFIAPSVMNSLPEAEKAHFWTVCENDLISRYSEDFTPNADLDEMKNDHEFYYVNSVIPCRSRGRIKLLEITGRGRSVDSE